jgi:hypothetical protein
MAVGYEFPDAAETDEIIVTVYPNPASDFVLISTDARNYVHLMDSKKNTVYHSVITTTNTFINLKNFEKGIYSLLIRNNKEARVIKILKI